MSDDLPPMQWEEILCHMLTNRDAAFNIMLSALVLENGGSVQVSVHSLRELQAHNRECSLMAEVEHGQLVIKLVENGEAEA
jgi:hypothetical protein